MRLKSYSAASVKEAMTLIRDDLGPDAIIIRTEEGVGNGGTVRITAAYEPARPIPVKDPVVPDVHKAPDIAGLISEAMAELNRTELSGAELNRARINGTEKNSAAASGARDSAEPDFDLDELLAVLAHHGIPPQMALMLQTAATSFAADSVGDAISSALETSFRFYNLPYESRRPLILVGPTGAGKTVACAKLAAEAVLQGKKVEIITIDTVKATGLEQLQKFASLMKCTVSAADTPEGLAELLDNRPTGDDAPDLTLIDTFGVNPFDAAELTQLARFIKQGQAEPVLVMPAGLDPADASEIAQIFASMGARLFVPTKMDAARRYASVLTAAQAGGMTIAALGNSPIVADKLEPASPLVLGRLMSRLPQKTTESQPEKRVAP